MNRDTRRALARAKAPIVPPPDGAGTGGQAAMTAALLEAMRSDCACRPCKLLRRVGGDLADSVLLDAEPVEEAAG